MRKILGRSLRQARTSGIDSVVEANDGAEALEKLNGDPIHMIFSDINMPNVNGLEFLRRTQRDAAQGSTSDRGHHRGWREDRYGSHLAGSQGIHPQTVHNGPDGGRYIKGNSRVGVLVPRPENARGPLLPKGQENNLMPAETTIDQQVIVDAVRGATENVFSTMMDLGIEALEPIDHSQPEAINGVVALLGFTGPWTGTGMFYCSDRFRL